MSRSSQKGPFVDPKLIKKISKLKFGDKTAVKTWSRDSVIAPEMVGFVLGIHNGRTHVEVLVKEEMVGHKLGEFSLTRKFVKHGGKMQKQLEAAAAATEAQKKAAAQTAPAAAAKK
jgi:small subunit ribosomal protein S19